LLDREYEKSAESKSEGVKAVASRENSAV